MGLPVSHCSLASRQLPALDPQIQLRPVTFRAGASVSAIAAATADSPSEDAFHSWRLAKRADRAHANRQLG